jgi:hypothetical protein
MMQETPPFTAPGALGEWLHTKLIETYGLEAKTETQARVRRVETRLQRTRLPADQFQVELLRLDAVTAFTAPGSYIYISRALTQRLQSDDALAFVIAHEIAHHDLGHIAVYQKRLELLGSLPHSSVIAILLSAAERLLFSPERERDADAQGLRLCLSMGFDGARCLETFDVLEAVVLEHDDPQMAYGPSAPSGLSTPGIEQWVAAVNSWVWQRARGYPSIRERKASLQALLPTDVSSFHSTSGTASSALTRPIQMTLDQIDQALETWRAKLQVATDNLLALDDNLTYKRLEGKDGLPTITLRGSTQQRVTPALEAIHALFQHIGLLSRVVERATELRKSVSRFRGADSTLREIEQLLYGPSISLPSDQTPLARRSLLSASETERTITPERLLAAMTAAFEEARDAIFAVDAAWAKLEPGLAACETEITTLQRAADVLGEGTLPELATAQQQAAALRTQVESDPLGASADFDTEITPLLERVRARLDQIKQQRDQTQTLLAQARYILAQLAVLCQQCGSALQECQEKIGNVAGLRAPLDPARSAELAQWLTTLEATWQEGRWQPVRVGLTRWLQTASEYVNAEKAALAANNAPLEMRAELRGRLAALKVKAQARGSAQDAALCATAQEAETLLHQYPVSLDRIARLVSDYEQRLSALMKR